MRGCKQNAFLCDHRFRCTVTAAFGLGVTVASFCPPTLCLFFTGVLLAALAISALRH